MTCVFLLSFLLGSWNGGMLRGGKRTVGRLSNDQAVRHGTREQTGTMQYRRRSNGYNCFCCLSTS